MDRTPVTRFVHASGRHSTSYLATGPEDGPLVVFVHGWPELSWSWRHQLPVFAALGFRAVAPDLRGYGRSTRYDRTEDYTLEEITADMVELLDGLGRDQAVWVGHDWGSPVVWSVASHHPHRARAVASLCVPYATLERGLDVAVGLVDRHLYPLDRYPVGQWDYIRYYEESFERATAVMDAHPYNLAKALFRKGRAEAMGKPTGTAFTRVNGGWFHGADEAPNVRPDHDVVTNEDLAVYAESLERNGFFGPNAFYVNDAANAAYAGRLRDEGRLDLPVLFLAARYDYTCEAVTSPLAEPMRRLCTDLTEAVLDSGHWMAQERPAEVNAALVYWLSLRVPDVWDRAVMTGRPRASSAGVPG